MQLVLAIYEKFKMTSLFFYSHVIVVERRLSKHEYELIIRGAMIGLTDGSPHLHQK